jgi:glycine hydroxymethyltransferase
LITAGASAYPRLIDFARLRAIADEVGALLMADIAHTAGLVAAGLHPTPIGHAHVTTTTTHKTLRGPRGGMIMSNADLGAKLDKSVFPGNQGGPLMHVIAAKAVAFGEALKPEFAAYQQRVVQNARALAEALSTRGVRLVTGGTDNHLMLVDLTPFGITGAQAQKALDAAAITVNKNAIPFDTQPPMRTSGIRLGTPAVTTRGFGPAEMERVAGWLVEVLEHLDDGALHQRVAEEVHELCRHFPVPGLEHYEE